MNTDYSDPKTYTVNKLRELIEQGKTEELNTFLSLCTKSEILELLTELNK